MADRIAIKKLSGSDCTLFEAAFRKNPRWHQKGINLNSDILTGEFYSTLSAVAIATNNQIPVAISVYGPSSKGPHSLSRKIVKSAGSKNWRLNGELINGPLGDATRYNDLASNDLAVMIFRGDAVPNAVDLILVSQTDPGDAALYSALSALLGNNTMASTSPDQIANATAAAGTPKDHPIHIAAADPETEQALEDAAQGGLDGTRKLLTNRGNWKISGFDLAKARAVAAQIGKDGEGLVNSYLAARQSAGEISTYEWISSENAIAPYDFAVSTAAGQSTLVDAKATSGPFTNVIHISLAEIIEASGDTPYHIYRVFELNEDGGKLRISDDIRPLAKQLKAMHEAHVPAGVRVDNFSVTTGALTWGPEEYFELPEDEGDLS